MFVARTLLFGSSENVCWDNMLCTCTETFYVFRYKVSDQPRIYQNALHMCGLNPNKDWRRYFSEAVVIAQSKFRLSTSEWVKCSDKEKSNRTIAEIETPEPEDDMSEQAVERVADYFKSTQKTAKTVSSYLRPEQLSVGVMEAVLRMFGRATDMQEPCLVIDPFCGTGCPHSTRHVPHSLLCMFFFAYLCIGLSGNATPHLHVGTTGVAALQLGCYFIGMETDINCAEKAEARLSKVTNKGRAEISSSVEKVNSCGVSLVIESEWSKKEEEEEEEE